MKMDRNINQDKTGKYAVLKLRQLRLYEPQDALGDNAVMEAVRLLEREGILDWGLVGTESEFMLIRLKDEFAHPALEAYANAAAKVDPEYAAEVREMASRSGTHSHWCKRPD